MKSSRLGRAGRLLVALLAVFALSAVVVASAQAVTEGPVWRINGKTLKAGEEKQFTVKAYEGTKNPIVLEGEIVKVKSKVECHLAKVAEGAVLVGGAPGTSKEVAEFSDCTVVNNGKECKVKEPIVTEKIKDELVYNDVEHTPGNRILEKFTPETGEKFVTLIFEGEHCTVKETPVTGRVLGSAYVDPTTGEPTEPVTLATPEAASAIVKFPDNEKSIYSLKGTTLELVEIASQLTAFSNPATLTGSVLVLLTSGEKFGVAEK